MLIRIKVKVEKALEYLLIFILMILIGCSFKSGEIPVNGNILLKMVGTVNNKEVEVVTIFNDGNYDFRFFHSKENSWSKSSGKIPDSIFNKIKEKGLYSNRVELKGDVYIYYYNLVDSVNKHPEGFGELLGFVWGPRKNYDQ